MSTCSVCGRTGAPILKIENAPVCLVCAKKLGLLRPQDDPESMGNDGDADS
jgi:hypothetical protein